MHVDIALISLQTRIRALLVEISSCKATINSAVVAGKVNRDDVVQRISNFRHILQIWTIEFCVGLNDWEQVLISIEVRVLPILHDAGGGTN